MTTPRTQTTRTGRRNLLALALALGLGAGGAGVAAYAQESPPDVDVGPAVGAHVPALMVRDAKGDPRTLKSLAGVRGVVLVFFRSARWCPFCQAQLIALRDLPAGLAARGYTLAAVSYDPPEALSEFAAKREIGYPLLSDAGSRTIDVFKLRDPQYKPESFAYGVPRPAIFVVSRDGVVRAKLAKEGYKVRPDNGAILAAIDRLGR